MQYLQTSNVDYRAFQNFLHHGQILSVMCHYTIVRSLLHWHVADREARVNLFLLLLKSVDYEPALHSLSVFKPFSKILKSPVPARMGVGVGEPDVE